MRERRKRQTFVLVLFPRKEHKVPLKACFHPWKFSACLHPEMSPLTRGIGVKTLQGLREEGEKHKMSSVNHVPSKNH